MRLFQASSVIVVAIAMAGVVSACDDDDRESIEQEVESVITEVADVADEVTEDAVELAARNFASTQTAQEFEAAGHPIDGDLTCEADATADLTAVDISCTGTTVDGGDASLTGATSELPGVSFDALEGAFVGTVDGNEVFAVDRLGD